MLPRRPCTIEKKKMKGLSTMIGGVLEQIDYMHAEGTVMVNGFQNLESLHAKCFQIK
jgi:hypothetical protein